MRAFRPLFSLAVLLTLGACDSATGPGGRILIHPRQVELMVLDTLTLQATVLDAWGLPVAGASVEWRRNPAEYGWSPVQVEDSRKAALKIKTMAPGNVWLVAESGVFRDSVEVRIRTRPDISLKSVHAGHGGSCGLDSEGKAHCWGSTNAGPAWTHAPMPWPLHFASIMKAPGRTCGLTAEGVAYCFGGYDPNMGMGPNRQYAPQPRPVSGGHHFTMLTLGLTHSCGVAEGGIAYCWGSHDFGQLGIGQASESCSAYRQCSSVPAPVAGGHRFRVLAAGAWHTCGVTTDYEVYCWGLNSEDQFGSPMDEECWDILYGAVPCSTTPVQVTDAPPLDTLVAGNWHTCGLTPGGEAYCWGHNGVGELGNGKQPEESLVPVPVAGGHRFAMLTPSCGLTAEGRVYCWGLGIAGYYTEDCLHGAQWIRCNPIPVPVQGEVRFRSISSNGSHVCGISLDGLPYCWGYNDDGQLGNGDRLERRFQPVPVQVLGTK